jgi:hypothetical protein
MKMFTISRIKKLIPPMLAAILATACHKQDFLDKKSSSNLVVPSSLNDFQALLDNDQIMGLAPVLGEISADNYYMDDSFLSRLDGRVQNAYQWAPDIFGSEENIEDWNIPYQQVYYSNVVLDGLNGVKITGDNQAQWNIVKGEALFLRAFAFSNIAQAFAPGYDNTTAGTDRGIPLRLSQDIDAPSIMASLKQTCDQLTADLRMASVLLPASVGGYLNRPSRPAAQSLLARIYLSMHKYDSAKLYADSVLSSISTLIDYNKLDTTSFFPVSSNNGEVLYQARSVDYKIFAQVLIGLLYANVRVDTLLMRSYAANDLRPGIFYLRTGRDSFILKGSYSNSTFIFCGLATDEVYLIRAECLARMGKADLAMIDLNALLVNRYRTNTFTPYTITDPKTALDTIWSQRRKELPFRGLRWADLKRLNKEGANIMLTRMVNGIQHTLAPNTKLYVLPVPPDAIRLGGIPPTDRN